VSPPRWGWAVFAFELAIVIWATVILVGWFDRTSETNWERGQMVCVEDRRELTRLLEACAASPDCRRWHLAWKAGNRE
jgi:hypothetical protein